MKTSARIVQANAVCVIKVWLSVQALTTHKISDRGANLGTVEFLAPIFCIWMLGIAGLRLFKIFNTTNGASELKNLDTLPSQNFIINKNRSQISCSISEAEIAGRCNPADLAQ